MSKNKRTSNNVEVSLQALSPLILECLAQGQQVVLTISGNSMSPFLRNHRDQVVLAPVDATALHPGDVPLFQRKDGRYVLHRIVEMDDGQKRTRWCDPKEYPSESDSLQFTMLGDAQSVTEPNIGADQIVARAVAFIRKGKRWECDSAAYQRHRRLWHRLLPLRKTLVWWDRRLEWRFRRLFPYKG